MAIPKPDPGDYLRANAQELALTDREVLEMLREAKKRVDKILAEMPKGKSLIRRAQLEKTRANLLAEQSAIFTKLGDITAARRASAASRAARLDAASDAALLALVGKGAQAQFLYDAALQTSQRAIDAALQRMKFSALPLSRRIYNTQTWMDGRLGRLINETLATGLNAAEFARRARDWFNPNTPGGVRYAALRLARTEINNAFHSMSAQKYAETPWIKAVEWNLSKSHPKPDICDALAEASPYPSDRVPTRPHPQCMCYITGEPESEEDFIENFLKGDYDEYIDRKLEENGWIDSESEPQPTAASSTPRAKKSAAPRKSRVLKSVQSRVNSNFSPTMRKRIDNVLAVQESFVDAKLDKIRGIHPNFNGVPKQLQQQVPNAAAFTVAGNIFLHKDIESRAAEMSKAQQSGWLSSCDHKFDSLEHSIAHECGHVFLGNDRDLQSLSRETERLLVEEIAAAYQLSVPADRKLQSLVNGNRAKISQLVSRYASQNRLELLAEIWGSYTLTENPSPGLKRAGEAIRTALKS